MRQRKTGRRIYLHMLGKTSLHPASCLLPRFALPLWCTKLAVISAPVGATTSEATAARSLFSFSYGILRNTCECILCIVLQLYDIVQLSTFLTCFCLPPVLVVILVQQQYSSTRCTRSTSMYLYYMYRYQTFVILSTAVLFAEYFSK